MTDHDDRYAACVAQVSQTPCQNSDHGESKGECECHGALRRYVRIHAQLPASDEAAELAFELADARARRGALGTGRW